MARTNSVTGRATRPLAIPGVREPRRRELLTQRDRNRPSLPAPRPRGLVERIRERKLGQWMLAYFALAWMGLQLTDALREIWDWPVGLQRGITLALALGILPAAVIAWYHGEKGRQRVCLLEATVVAALIAGAAWVILSVAG